jgi:GT2 family glycosyltransferase
MEPVQGISVVIPNYNGAKLLPIILPTVQKALAQVELPSEIIISDDASIDESEKITKELYPNITWLHTPVNTGFSATANRGFKKATFSWVLLLNSDVKLEANYFQQLLPYMQRPEVFGVMGRIIGWNDDIVQDGAKYPFFHGAKLKTSKNCISNEMAVNTNVFSLYLSGANAFIQKKHFDKLEGFNELFSPYYAEDTELSIRAWRTGLLCLYHHTAVCRHQVSVTIKAKSSKKNIELIYNRNKMYLHLLHLNGIKLFAWYIQAIGEALLRLLTLNPDYAKSFLLAMKNKKQVAIEKKKLEEKATGKKLLSLQQVCKKIADNLDSMNPQFF